MNVLVSFASTEGQTHKIAERVGVRARERGHDVCLYDSASLYEIPDVDAFDAVLVAGSVHEGLHQDSIVNFTIAHRDQLNRKSRQDVVPRSRRTLRRKIRSWSTAGQPHRRRDGAAAMKSGKS